MSNPWVKHVKDYAEKNNLSYMCAMSTPPCKASYVKPTPVKKSKTTVAIPFVNTFIPKEKFISPEIRKQNEIDFQKRKEERQNKLKKIQDDYYNKLVEIYKTRKKLNDNDKEIIDEFRYQNKIITGYDNLITFNEFKKKQK